MAAKLDVEAVKISQASSVFGLVDLTTDVVGVLPVANGGSGLTDTIPAVHGHKNLVSGAAAVPLFEISLPGDDQQIGYQVHYTITFADGTNAAINEGMVHSAAYRANGGLVTTANPVEAVETNVKTGGTNTVDTWTSTAGAGKITVLLTATKGNAVGVVTLGAVHYAVRLSDAGPVVTIL
jgi:hypothetical protein